MPTNPWPICDANPRGRASCVRRRAATTAVLATLLGLCATVAANPAGITRLPDASQAMASNDSVYFATGTAHLDAEANSILQRHVDKLRSNPELQLTIVAHTDELGSASLELARSQLRLDAVCWYLDGANISPGRVRALNSGSENGPPSPCNDDECRRSRRRVDFLFHR